MELKKYLGICAFLIGVLITIIIAIIGSGATWLYIALAIIGVIVGIFNVNRNESINFLIATIAFMVTFQSLGDIVSVMPIIGSYLENFFQLLNVLIAPAAAIVAICTIFKIVKD